MTAVVGDGNLRSCHDDCELPAGGYAYHVLNRGVGKMRLFAKERDFEAFEEIIGQACYYGTSIFVGQTFS